MCPPAGCGAQLSSTHPCRHQHIPACLPQDHIQPAHSLFATASGKQPPHTSTSLAAQVSWMASLGAVAGKAGPHLAALHTGGHVRRQRVLVASAPAVPQLWHSSQGFTQPRRTWAAAQPPGPVQGTQHRPQCHRAPHHGPAPAPWLAFGEGHDTHAASPEGDTRPVSLPSFQPLQEMMHLSLAQAALGESWAHLSSQGSGWGVPLPRL